MIRTLRSSAIVRVAGRLALMTVAGAALTTGCTNRVPAPVTTDPWVHISADKDLPDFMNNTIRERAIVEQTEPHNVSGYGLVGQLRGTGDSTCSNVVRQYMIKEMVRRGFGDSLMPGYEKTNPVDVLKDPNYAIVRVDAFIPPGARKDDFIDAQVTCLPGNNTVSLAHGTLFETDLKDGGADVDNPSGAVNTRVVVKGAILVNPVYAMENPLKASAEARSSLRVGAILANAKVKQDRPILLQLRDPQGSIARRIQDVIAYRFQDVKVSQAINEAIVNLYVPKSYRGDWNHFIEVVRHLYLNNSPEFNQWQSQKLAKLAVQPDADVENIAYCLEGIGAPALEYIRPLLTHSDQRVTYFMARAAAFIGDPTQAAERRLMQMAQTKGHPYRLAAVRTLGQLPPSASLNAILAQLLESDMTLIRIAAYQILCRTRDNSNIPDGHIQRQYVAPINDPRNQKFILDIVRPAGNSTSPPLIYVSRSGLPRIAIIGNVPAMDVSSPVAMADNRLTFANDRGNVVIFYRDPSHGKATRVLSQRELPLLVAHLGGMGAEGQDICNFTYGEIVAILQKLTQNNRLVARDYMGREWPAAFIMQEPGRLDQDLANAPLIDVAGGNEPPKFGPAMPGNTPEKPIPVAQPTNTGSNVPSFGPPMQPNPVGGGVGSNAPKF